MQKWAVVENLLIRYGFDQRLFYPTERPFKALAVGSSPTELTKTQYIVVFLDPNHNLLTGSTSRRALVEAKARVEGPFLTLSSYCAGTLVPLHA